MITCREFVEFLADYLAGELLPANQAEFEFHLTDCPDCSSYLKSYEETIRLGKAVCSDLDALEQIAKGFTQAVEDPVLRQAQHERVFSQV